MSKVYEYFKDNLENDGPQHPSEMLTVNNKTYKALTIKSKTVGRLLNALYDQYPEGASSMPNKLEEAVLNTLYELDKLEN